MNEFILYNPEDPQFDLSKDDFVLVQKDTKIKDKKIETKPTTFIKDAFRRFCKNKSSVVGAWIIGILVLLAIFLPIFVPYNVTDNSDAQTFLTPKLFNAGTGWWDGCKTYTDKTVERYVDGKAIPTGCTPNSVVRTFNEKVTYTNTYYPNGIEGYVVLQAKTTSSKNAYAGIRNYTYFDIDLSENYSLSVDLGDPNALVENYGEISGENMSVVPYTIYLTYNKDASKAILVSESTDYSKQNFNLTEALKALNLTGTVKNVRVNIDIPRGNDVNNYILIKTVEVSCENSAINNELKKINLDDATKNYPLTKLDDGTFPINYWQAKNSYKNLYASELVTCDVVIDLYEKQIGLKNDYIIGGTDMQKYIDNGWCEYTYGDPSSFKKLSDKCPVESVTGDIYNAENDTHTITTDIVIYKYLGFDTMPRYLLGTDSNGKEIIKLAFKCLRTSLIVAVIVSAINLFIGVVWGSISGYFGGTVDLLMERFCEILSGVPGTIVLTIAMLMFGRTLTTFGIAVCITGWMGAAARTRTQFYRFKGREYVLASRTLGAGDFRLIFKHILPNALGTIVTSVVLMIPGVIFSEASLAYLGLGVNTGDSFGVLLSKNQTYLSTFPALIIFPSIIISLLMISFNLFGNGLRDALNPSLKGSE